MRLVVLYGPPGVGKLTVGSVLSALTGFRLFHNHLTVDLVTSVFLPNTDGWNRLARRVRLAVFEEAARERVDLILTRAPRDAGPSEVDRVRTMTEPIRAAGGAVVFVQLTCAREVLLQRVREEPRQRQGKLTNPNVLIEMYDLGARLPCEPHLRVDTTHMAPAEAAARIAAHFALPTVGG